MSNVKHSQESEPQERPIVERRGTKFPECPFCGAEHLDYCDFTHDGDYECEDCGKTFYCRSETELLFWTSSEPQ